MSVAPENEVLGGHYNDDWLVDNEGSGYDDNNYEVDGDDDYHDDNDGYDDDNYKADGDDIIMMKMMLIIRLCW